MTAETQSPPDAGGQPAPTSLIRPAVWTERLQMGTWFDLSRPLEVDVGCGKGRFLLAKAARNTGTNFLGIDRMLRRLRRLDRKVLRAGLSNVRLLRVEAAYGLEYLLPPASVSVFYVFFPDPWPKRRHHPRRVFSPAFVNTLASRLTPGGVLHFATDHDDYFRAVTALLGRDARFAPMPAYAPAPDEATDFELEFAAEGKAIGRASYRLTGDGQTAAPALAGGPALSVAPWKSSQR